MSRNLSDMLGARKSVNDFLFFFHCPFDGDHCLLGLADPDMLNN